MKDNDALSSSKYNFNFNLYPLPIRKDGVLGIGFPPEFDISSYFLVGTSFTEYKVESMTIYLKLNDNEFMVGDLVLENIRAPALVYFMYLSIIL